MRSARGGGKSWAVRAKIKLLALNYAGIKMLLVRQTYPELLNNHINILVADLNGIAKYNRSDKMFTFFNGSTLKCGYCSCDSDLTQYQGSEYHVLFLDEATNLSEYQMKIITACMRGTESFPRRCYFTCNPSGQGMQYIKRLFIDRKFKDGEDPNDFQFIQSLVTDNFALMEAQPDYINQLKALPSKLRAGWLEGRWDCLEGMFFEEWQDDEAHYQDHMGSHVIEPFEIPADWKVYRAMDWGYSRPFSILYGFVSPDDIIYIGLEIYGCTGEPNVGLKWTPDKVFSEVHKFEQEHRWLKGKQIIGVADPAMWNAEYGESIAETASKHQVFFSKGDHERLAGWLQVHYRLAMDENQKSKLYVFKNCKDLIRCFPLQMYDPHKPEDLDSDLEDHCLDSLRYMLMSRPIKPAMTVPYDPYNETPMAQYLNIPKEDLIKRPKRQRMEIIK